jgi:hypothetical protein
MDIKFPFFRASVTIGQCRSLLTVRYPKLFDPLWLKSQEQPIIIEDEVPSQLCLDRSIES